MKQMPCETSKQLVYHIDVNSAFLSWESVERLKEDPNALDLRTIACAVGGDASSRRGIVLAKSTLAKQCGVATGEPLTKALNKCPEMVVVPSRFEIYISNSRRLLKLLEEYTPDIEKFSIDEAFLDMTHTIHLFGSPVETAHQIRNRIHHELGFTVNIGISSNKLLAKMASDFEKPNRCHTLWSHEVPQKMWPLPVRQLFSVGSSAQKKLEELGIRTIGQLASCNAQMLEHHLGKKYTQQIIQYARGIDPSPVGEHEPAVKCYGNSTTLPRDVSDLETAFQVLLSLSETVGARLRADSVFCSCICVEIKDWRFKTQSHQLTLSYATDSTSILYQNSCSLLKEFWDLTPLRLIGLRVSHITEESYEQLSLFSQEQERSQKFRDAEKAVDTIRQRFGIDSIKRASFLSDHAIVDHAASKKKHLGNGQDKPARL